MEFNEERVNEFLPKILRLLEAKHFCIRFQNQVDGPYFQRSMKPVALTQVYLHILTMFLTALSKNSHGEFAEYLFPRHILKHCQ